MQTEPAIVVRRNGHGLIAPSDFYRQRYRSWRTGAVREERIRPGHRSENPSLRRTPIRRLMLGALLVSLVYATWRRGGQSV
jgi:hypothetical protein